MTDQKLIVSFGEEHPARITAVRELTWPEYIKALVGEVPETTDKASRGWSIPAKFEPAYRDSEHFKWRYMLTFDYDHIDVFDWENIKKTYEKWAHLEYTTYSHTEDNPRWRLVFPLKRPVTYDEFQAISRKVATWVENGIELTSRETDVPAQMMYLPTRKVGGPHESRVVEGEWIDPDGVLATYVDWTDRGQWPKRKDADGVQAHGKGEDPRTKPGIIGAFCRAFPISAAISRFELPYIPTSTDGRWTYTRGSRPEGAIVYDDDTKLHSHHDTDPARGQSNAFDLVRLHKFGTMDAGVAGELPITERPSFKSMVALAAEQTEVAAAQATEEFEDLGALSPEQEKAAEENKVIQIPFSAGRPIESALEKALKALCEKGPSIGIVTFGGRLVWAVEIGGQKGFNEVETSVLELRGITGQVLPAIWVNKIAFVRKQKGPDGGFVNVRVDCPPTLANAVATRADALKEISVERVTCTPIYDRGTLYAERGFSRERKAWILAPEGVHILGTERSDGKAALDRVVDWLSEFPFDTAADRDVAVAALLTSALRASLPHAPGFLVTKPDYGSGASTLCDLINVVLTGRPSAVIDATVGKIELDKKLDGAQLAGRPSIVIDNVPDGEIFNSISLAQILTQPTRDIRALGKSEMARTPCQQMVLVNGNNVRIGDDLVRRFVRIHLDPRCESPHRRKFKRPDMIRQATEERAALLSDLYTILAAYDASPDRIMVPPMAGFEDWSRHVVEPLVWLGLSNPTESQKTIEKEDDKRVALRGVMHLWSELFGEEPALVKDLFDEDLEDMARNDLKKELREGFSALSSISYDSRKGISCKSIGHVLKGVAGKMLDGKHFVDTGLDRKGSKKWQLLKTSLPDWLD